MINRASPGIKGFGGRGRMERCKRCGTDFQPERVETMENGDEHVFRDDRCPHCGWDVDDPDPDRRR